MHEILFAGEKYEHGDVAKIMKCYPTNLAKKKNCNKFPQKEN
jgi:hypothetical protein